MAEVLFYHLERSRAEDVLPDLLEKSLARRWRAVLRLPDRDAVEAMDRHLWEYRDESFLPHGTDADAARHPIWLTDSETVPDDRDILFVLGGAPVPMSALGGLTRTVLLFTPAEAGPAREVWRDVKEQGLKASYWRQTPAGKWEQAA